MTLTENIMLMLLLWLGGYAVYLLCNHGLAKNARLQQLLRYLAGALVAVVPLAVTGTSPVQPASLLALAVAVMWMVTYPLTYHLTHRRNAPDYDNQIDVAFGIYLYGQLSGLMLLPSTSWVIGAVIFVLCFVPVWLWGYYLTCHNVLDDSGMKMLQETDYNEILEFLHSYSWIRVAGTMLFVLLLAVVFVVMPLRHPLVAGSLDLWRLLIALAAVVFMMVYTWKPRHGLFVRTGIASLYSIVREYVTNNSLYTEQQQQRLQSLNVSAAHPLDAPHTIIMVIGESASRDFMSAFTTMEEQTTPWLDELSSDTDRCILFPHAYSCDIQTVPVLEKALTEYNQYDGGQFYTSCSIVDIAHRLGYHVHWYSNQGHLGAADTPITLVANTSDVAKWTKQELSKAQYDETLLEFLDEVSPERNNMVVLHLIGSHFNYENRFKEETRQWGEPRSHDQVTNYKNTIYYTDSVLHRVFDYARQHLNLQAMVYCSDHADVPDRHRQPNFGGFRDTRIPLAVWLGDDYRKKRPERAKALHDNRQRYWTNDLLYDLMCGLMDAQGNHFREENSLASTTYRFQRDELTAMNGSVRIANDSYDQ